MVIQSSDVTMCATRSYFRYKGDSLAISSWGNEFGINSMTASTLPTAKDSISESDENSKNRTTFDVMDAYEQGLITYEGSKVPSTSARTVGEAEIEYLSFQNMLSLMLGENAPATRMTPLQLFRLLLDKKRDDLRMLLYGAASTSETLSASEVWTQEITYENLSMEEEKTTFTSSGKVVTADGRTIDFDVQAKMSHTFLSYSGISVNYQRMKLIDPLVINLGNNTTEVTDQTFLFDLDLDGKRDNLSVLSEMCGYLAYDRNGDGTINDGGELFGAKTGDGFYELAVFDLDKNGWIDENDEIFNSLKVWTKDKNGNDKLIALGIAGVGAIYLGSIPTQFMVHSSDSNEVNGEIKSSGIYLKENGEVGTIQQYDYALK